MADGQAVPALAETLEPCILDGDLPPLVQVGVHSAPSPSASEASEYDPKRDPHAEEYLPLVNPSALRSTEGSLFTS
ncbi:MAG TPA: hypothetical protein VF171_02015 [Trueperaceae bacterium]